MKEFGIRHALVVGMGKSGFAMMNVLHRRGYKVSVYDSKPRDKILDLDWITSHSDRFFFGVDPEWRDVDVIAVSPGVPMDLPWLAQAKDSGIPVLGEMEWAFLFARGPIYGITGTNGKTTTTQLTYDLFNAHFPQVELVGNIGIPAVERADMAPEGTKFIAELSSYQLETIDTFRVEIGAILNLTPDHLQRHKTMEKYFEAKCRIFENLPEHGYRVLNHDDPILREYGMRFDNTFFFSRSSELERGCVVTGGRIVIRDGKEIPVVDTRDVTIPGAHNLENIAAAVSIAYLAGIPVETIAQTVRAFKGVAHRLEVFAEKDGRVFINDSKATNPDATIKALEAMTGPTVLIAGGMDKGSDYTDMMRTFTPHVRHLVLYGETKWDIKTAAEKDASVTIEVVDDLPQAVDAAWAASREGDTILLSPACASWDMYPNFEVRGDHFKELVKKLES